MGDFLGASRCLSFGPFALDLDCRQLVAGTQRQPVHLSPKAYELLCVLLHARPKALSKDDLHQQLWPSTFVSEATLASLVGDLREALGKHCETRFIRTVHGFGYAFSEEARETGASVDAPVRHWIIWNGRERPLTEGEHLIGRDADAALALGSPSVSRHHAKLVVAGDVITLEDLGSKNGTFLRGKAVTSPTALADGDQIRIGAFELTFRTLNAMGSTETRP